MEPYITYRDYYSAEIGNPDIRSEYINSFELNYKKNIGEHTVSATVPDVPKGKTQTYYIHSLYREWNCEAHDAYAPLLHQPGNRTIYSCRRQSHRSN